MAQLDFPRGQVAMNGGDLVQVQDATLDIVNGGKVISTLRSNPAGFVKGNLVATLKFNGVVSEDGPERDWPEMVATGDPQQVIFKAVPGTKYTIDCNATDMNLSLTMEEGTKFSVTLMGALVRIG